MEIPALQAQYDSLETELQSGIMMGAQETTVKRTTLWNNISDLTARFAQWKIAWVDNYPDGPPKEVETEPNDQFPTFYCRDLRTGAIIKPTRFVYPNLRLAQTMCLYYAARLVLSAVDTRPDRVGPVEQYG